MDKYISKFGTGVPFDDDSFDEFCSIIKSYGSTVQGDQLWWNKQANSEIEKLIKFCCSGLGNHNSTLDYAKQLGGSSYEPLALLGAYACLNNGYTCFGDLFSSDEKEVKHQAEYDILHSRIFRAEIEASKQPKIIEDRWAGFDITGLVEATPLVYMPHFVSEEF